MASYDPLRPSASRLSREDLTREAQASEALAARARQAGATDIAARAQRRANYYKARGEMAARDDEQAKRAAEQARHARAAR